MSDQSDLQSFLKTLAGGQTGTKVDITPVEMAEKTGITRDKVNKTLHNLMTRKRIDLLRGENGRAIVGYRLLEAPPDRRRKGGSAPTPKARRGRAPRAAAAAPAQSSNGSQAPAAPRRRVAYTPLLDTYVDQKKRFAQMVEQLGDRVEATFRDDPLAEEALLLRERLDIAETELHDWRGRAEAAELQARGLRGRQVATVGRKAAEAGAMVQHSTD